MGISLVERHASTTLQTVIYSVWVRKGLPVDIQGLSDSLALFKSGMEGMRGALTLWRDFKGTLPEGKREEVEKAIELSEKQLQLAEAQIAKALGYQLCTCTFPPTPMLKVGYCATLTPIPERGLAYQNRDVHECPKCHQTDARGDSVFRQVDIPGVIPGFNVA
jgi:hypothetical protein